MSAPPQDDGTKSKKRKAAAMAAENDDQQLINTVLDSFMPSPDLLSRSGTEAEVSASEPTRSEKMDSADMEARLQEAYDRGVVDTICKIDDTLSAIEDSKTLYSKRTTVVVKAPQAPISSEATAPKTHVAGRPPQQQQYYGTSGHAMPDHEVPSGLVPSFVPPSRRIGAPMYQHPLQYGGLPYYSIAPPYQSVAPSPVTQQGHSEYNS